MSLNILFHFLCTQHVSDINISIIRSLRLFCWITTSVVLFTVRCVLEIWCGWFWVVSVLQATRTQRTENKTADVVIQQHSRKLLVMDILISETCWAHKKWNKIASDIKLVFYSSTITMMHGPINIIFCFFVVESEEQHSRTNRLTNRCVAICPKCFRLLGNHQGLPCASVVTFYNFFYDIR